MSPPPSLPSWCKTLWSLALNDCGYLLVDLLASALTHRQHTLYIAARVILLKHNINHAVYLICSKFFLSQNNSQSTYNHLPRQRIKGRDITLPRKYSQSYSFPVVMYRCESWTIKKAEHWMMLELWCWRRLLRVPWTARRSDQSILKEIRPDYSLEGLMLKLKLQYFGHLT